MSTPTTSKPARAYPTEQPPAPQNRSSSRGLIAAVDLSGIVGRPNHVDAVVLDLAVDDNELIIDRPPAVRIDVGAVDVLPLGARHAQQQTLLALLDPAAVT